MVPATNDAFDRDWLVRSPFQWMHPAFRARVATLNDWPAPDAYDDLASAVPREGCSELPRFVRQNREALRESGGYEQHVAQRRAVPTRPSSWHDFFNMAVWAHFPALRWALNALHVEPGNAPKAPGNGRTPAQNSATSFDETGVVVMSESLAVLEGLRALQLKRVFWEQRAELLQTTRFWIVGHGLLESLLTPHAHLLGRSLLLHQPDRRHMTDEQQRHRADERVAAHIRTLRDTKAAFDPIPVCAIPGFADNDSAAFYDDRERLPFEPVSRRPPGAADFLR